MSTELTRTRDHLKLETMALYECIVLRDMDRAQDHAETIISLVVHLKALEKRDHSVIVTPDGEIPVGVNAPSV